MKNSLEEIGFDLSLKGKIADGGVVELKDYCKCLKLQSRPDELIPSASGAENLSSDFDSIMPHIVLGAY